MAVDQEVAFPTLAPHDLSALAERGRERRVRAGDVLYSVGDTSARFFVVLEGEIEAIDGIDANASRVATIGPGQFTGEVSTLSGRAALVTVRAARDSRLIELDGPGLLRAVDELPDVGEAVVRAFLLRRQMLIDTGTVGVQIVGSRFSPAAHQLRDFATRNLVPFRWVDVENDPEAEILLRRANYSPADTPVVIGKSGKYAKNPTIAQFAHCAGLTATFSDDHVYDLVVVGAGPAGLAASVYAASEGLDVMTADQLAAGGQAGTSARIENYLGFPAGISGKDLTTNALVQAQRFGARITVPCLVRSLGLDGGDRVVTLADSTRLRTRCVLVASGVAYRKLEVPRFADFEGAGIYYAATEMEARLCRGEEAVVVGGGNSAGQAVVFLARASRHVHLLVRGPDLGASMSRYLIDRLQALENVTIHLGTQVTALEGDGRLSAVRTRDRAERELTVETGALFLFIGADPNTSWLRNCVALDKNGFVLTGPALPADATENERWRLAARAPFLLETSLPGVFAAGDVRSGSIKRVAAAVGEGSQSVSFVHAHIQRPV
ncbi:MAG TPA: FAD-dependent oxidoreductase [Gemmatimonadales bacterium]|nr:FAD-dependent oxidoreductase [Gemmatimonadales bacterium]